MLKSSARGSLTGAAFLMATAAVGPGFITQTTVFTRELYTSFGFAILISIIVDLVVQLNIWRLIAASGLRAPVLAEKVRPGMGWVLAVLVAFGGLAFNVGNIGGCALALHTLTGMDYGWGAVWSAGLALAIFAMKAFGRAMDVFVKVAGLVMIALMCYVAVVAKPPLGEMALRSVWPEQVSVWAIITLIGGTVGGYISFAGAHRMLKSGYRAPWEMPKISRAAVSGILLAGLMRILLFAAVAAVAARGIEWPAENPAAAVFQHAAGETGLRLFGVILWAAAMTSVVAAAYTSVSFLSAVIRPLQHSERLATLLFIVLSLLLFLKLGQPTRLLVWAGTLNGMILPLALAILLLAARRAELMRGYLHPRWMQIAGWATVVLMGAFSLRLWWQVLGSG